MTTAYHLPAGKAAGDAYAVNITPESAGWGYSSLRVLGAAARRPRTASTPATASGSCCRSVGGCTVAVPTTAGHVPSCEGRASVFSGVSDFAYVPRDAQAAIASRDGGRFALTGARCERRLPARYGPASARPGRAARHRQLLPPGQQLRAPAEALFECDKLIAVEVITPGGNWSSYPPHKHDEHRPGEESELEEIYYFEIADHEGTPGLGYQRVSPSGHGTGTDVLAEVRGGDVVLIPDGWHGPSMAAPGHDMYYLNVMAGPGADRAWLICDHPDHAWIRGTWPEQPVDPRLPLYTAPTGPEARDRSSGPSERPMTLHGRRG